MSNSPAQPWRGRCFFTTASSSIPRVDPPDTTPTRRLRHKANKTVTATVASVNHTVSTPHGDAPLADACIAAGARKEVDLPADDTRAVPQRRTSGFFARRGADADGVAALLEAASKGTRDRRCSGDVCGVRRPFRKGLLKSAGAGMTASRSCVRVPSDVTDGNTQRLCGGSPTHPHRRPDCCERSQRDTTPHRVSCRLVTALLLAFCCAGHPGRPSVLNALACSLWCGGRVPNSEAPEPSAPTRALTALDTARVARVVVWLLLALWNHNGNP